MRRREKIQTACLRIIASAHEQVGLIMSEPFVPKNGFRPLSRGEVEAVIGRLDLKPRAIVQELRRDRD